MRVWNDPRPGPDDDVVCIACGETVPRSEAREYDRYGDRWEREGKRFEYLCKPCDKDSCHKPRDDLERMLVEAGAGETDRESFLRAFLERCEENTGARSGH